MSFKTEVVPMKDVIAKWNLPLLSNRSKDPRLQPISEMRVFDYTTDSYELLIKPNFHLLNKKLKLNLDEFFIGPIEVSVRLDGTMTESRKSFSRENHPLNSFNPNYYKYYFDTFPVKRMTRFILTQRSLDTEPTLRGQADVFLKNQGIELKSLSEVSGLKFNRILPITEQIYLTEVFDAPTNTSKIQVLEYDPIRGHYEVYSDYSADKSISNILADLFTPYNPQELFDLKFNPVVFNEFSDSIQFTAKKYALALFRGTNKYEKLPLGGTTMTGPGFQKFIETRPLMSAKDDVAFVSHYEGRTTRVNTGFFTGIKDISSSTIQKTDKKTGQVQTWNIPGSSLSQYVYGVDGGVIIQREGLNEQKVLQHEIFFLSNSGEYKVISDTSSNPGTMTVFDGHLFFFGPSGENLNIWKLNELL